jgi:hypothetical protein
VALELDVNQEILKWDYEDVVIKYYDDNLHIRNYYVDFHVIYKDKEEILEAKPKFELLPIKKYIAANEYANQHKMIYRVVTPIEVTEGMRLFKEGYFFEQINFIIPNIQKIRHYTFYMKRVDVVAIKNKYGGKFYVYSKEIGPYNHIRLQPKHKVSTNSI